MEMVLRLYRGAINYTHDGLPGVMDKRESYMLIDNAAHDIAFWLGGEEGLREWLTRGKGEWRTTVIP